MLFFAECVATVGVGLVAYELHSRGWRKLAIAAGVVTGLGFVHLAYQIKPW